MKNRFRVKGILMDLDGTIVDSREAYIEAVKAAIAATEWRHVDVEMALEIPRKLEQNLPLNDIVKGIDIQKFLDAYLKAYHQLTATKTRPFPKISDTLEKLLERAKLALITMRYVPKERIVAELENFGLAKYFQYILTALDTRNPKPSPEALKKCAELLDLSADECLVVGDSVSDVKAGKAAGAKTVAVLSGIFSREELEREEPDLILESVNQLPDFIE